MNMPKSLIFARYAGKAIASRDASIDRARIATTADDRSWWAQAARRWNRIVLMNIGFARTTHAHEMQFGSKLWN